MRGTCSNHQQRQYNAADCNNTCHIDIHYHPEQQEQQYECDWNEEYRSNSYRSFYANEMIGSSFRFLPSVNSQLDVIVEEAIVFFDDDDKDDDGIDDDEKMEEQKEGSSDEGEEENSNPAQMNQKQGRQQCQDKRRDQEDIVLNTQDSVKLNFTSTEMIAKRVSQSSSSLAKSSTNTSISNSACGYQKFHLPEHKHDYYPEVTNATTTSYRSHRLTTTASKSSLSPNRYENEKGCNNFTYTSSLKADGVLKSSAPSDSYSSSHPYQGNDYYGATVILRNGDGEKQNQTQPHNDENNKIIEICPGIVLRLRGAKETIDAIKSDFFMPHSCCCCQKSIFCIQDADYVLCPDCRVVTPILTMNRNNQVGDGRGGVGLGFTFEDLRHYHEEIALTRAQSTTTTSTQPLEFDFHKEMRGTAKHRGNRP